MVRVYWSVALVVLLQTSFAFGSDCGNFSGDYFTGVVYPRGTDGPRQLFYMSIVQDGCNSIAVGSYSLTNGTRGDEVLPKIEYVGQGMDNLCQSEKCFHFSPSASGGISIAKPGNSGLGAHPCHYGRAEWNLDDKGNLLVTGFTSEADDSEIACWGKHVDQYDRKLTP